jgi:hypothetical protein
MRFFCLCYHNSELYYSLYHHDDDDDDCVCVCVCVCVCMCACMHVQILYAYQYILPLSKESMTSLHSYVLYFFEMTTLLSLMIPIYLI